MLLSQYTASNTSGRARYHPLPLAQKQAPPLTTQQDDATQAAHKQLKAEVEALEKERERLQTLEREKIECCGFAVVEKSEQSRLVTYACMILLFATLIWTSREAIVETLNYAMEDYHDGLRIGLLWLIVAVVILVVFVFVLTLPTWATMGSATGGVQNGVMSAAYMRSRETGSNEDDTFLSFAPSDETDFSSRYYGDTTVSSQNQPLLKTQGGNDTALKERQKRLWGELSALRKPPKKEREVMLTM